MESAHTTLERVLRMAHVTKVEDRTPSKTSLNLVDIISEEIKVSKQELSDWWHGYIVAHRKRIAFDVDYIRQYVPKSHTILDVGAVPLLLIAALRKLGYTVHGVDIAPQRFQGTIDKLGLDVKQCNIELQPLPYESRFFDTIVFNEIFEHLRIDLIFTMREAFRVLRPGGLLMLSTPNLKSLDGVINFLFGNKAFSCCADIFGQYQKMQSLGHMGHVREYTVREIQEFLYRVGFVVHTVIYRGSYGEKWKNHVATFKPSLKPFFTLLAIRSSFADH